MNSLLRGSEVYIAPPPPPPAPSPEYVALMDRLRKEEEMRQYRALLTKNSELYASGGDEPAAKDDVTPSLVFNILLSVIMCGAAMFYMTRWWSNDAWRVLASMLVAIVVGVAEVVVYAGYLRKVKLSREKEQRIKERKEVIGEVTGEEDERMQLTAINEKEEIWGRGVNGGVRQRVRDKWKKEQANEGEK